MINGNWNEIHIKIQNEIKNIFINYNFDELSKYEIRKVIFYYLCNNLKYDYSLYKKIRKFNISIKKGLINKDNVLVRNPYLELKNVIDNNIGICNSISQYYKLLLEEVGIKSYCVICDDGTLVNHQLNMVYDEEKDTYSFDDITNVIVGSGDLSTFFDYDLETANSLNQGNEEILDDNKWVILEEEYISYLVGKESPKYKTIDKLPSNISMVKQNNGYHI